MLPEFSGFDPFFSSSFSEININRSELLELANIYGEAFSGAPWFESWSEQDALLELAQYLSEAKFIVKRGEDGNTLGFGIGLALKDYVGLEDFVSLGFVAPESAPRTFYIAELCTKKEARGRGVCTAVVQELVSTARDNGYQNIITRTRSDNYGMIRIFEKCGFKQLGSSLVETGGISSERVILSRPT
jgi:ribosomal protein S18 acetylase RimI-like enzyme